jgi:murein DD-endopeptidase MepM/ murein hydrolase activator NlpD/Rod binding domain-containing protein
MKNSINFPFSALGSTENSTAVTSNTTEAESKRVAQEFEAIMLGQLTTALQPQVDDNEEAVFGSEGSLPQQLLAEQMASTLASAGGIGMADVIMSQLHPHKASNASVENAIQTAQNLRAIHNPLSATNSISGKEQPSWRLPEASTITRPRRVMDMATLPLNKRVEKTAGKTTSLRYLNKAKEPPGNQLTMANEAKYTGNSSLDAIIKEASNRHQIDPYLIAAIIGKESAYKQHAVSHKGASGYMQMMPSTFARFAGNAKNIFDSSNNIQAGTAYLRFLHDKYNGDIDKVLAGYNAGEGNVDRHGGVPPFRETRNFVVAVKREYQALMAGNRPALTPDPDTIATQRVNNLVTHTNAFNTISKLPKVKYHAIKARPIESAKTHINDIKSLKSLPQETDISNNLQMPLSGRISSQFGARRAHGRHKGIDIAAAPGTPINAAEAGKVIFAGWHRGYGRMVLIEHANGRLTRYAHAQRLLVNQGDSVQSGQQIAAVGSSGHSKGPHLHFEVIAEGKHVNPLRVVQAKLSASSPATRPASHPVLVNHVPAYTTPEGNLKLAQNRHIAFD